MILYPQSIYADPFRGGDNIMVLCDCYKPNGEPIDNNTRKACAEIMEKVSSRVRWGRANEFRVSRYVVLVIRFTLLQKEMLTAGLSSSLLSTKLKGDATTAGVPRN